MATNVESPIQSCSNKSTEEPEKPQDPNMHWIKFKVQDESGKPMSNVTLPVTLPDGSVVEKTSDENGMIEINNIDPGNCHVETDWEDHSVSTAVFIK